jgi:hypothetical protein
VKQHEAHLLPGDRELLRQTLSSALTERREAERELQRRASYKYANGDEAKVEALIRYVLSLGDAVKKLAEEMPASEPSPIEELAARQREQLKAS